MGVRSSYISACGNTDVRKRPCVLSSYVGTSHTCAKVDKFFAGVNDTSDKDNAVYISLPTSENENKQKFNL